MKHPARFEGLGPPGMARRFGEVGEAASERLERARASVARFGVTVAPAAGSPVAEAVPPKAPCGTEAARGRGRPAKHADKPWEAEGISRALWYRRRKAGEEGSTS